MPKWTYEQEEAIYKKGKNIIVSAGAGSGKTAVLTERVITHLKDGVSIDDLLILTFTNAAAAEMKDRIRKKIKENPSLKENLDIFDNAPITTFDAYALSLVKKYHHVLNISSDIKIADNTFIDLKKEEFLNEIFDNYYKAENGLFLKLLDDFSLKDDKEIFNNILKLYNKFSTIFDMEGVLNSYISSYYDIKTINNYISDYEVFLREKVNEIKKVVDKLSLYVDGSYIEKLSLENLYNASTYNEIKNSIVYKLPRLPSGVDEVAKNIKKEVSSLLKELQDITIYENKDDIFKTIMSTREHSSIIVDILLKLNDKLFNYKRDNNLYEFIDISNMAIKLLKDNEEIRQHLKDKYFEIMIDEYQDTNDFQEYFVSLIEKNNVYMVGDIKQSIYRFRNTNPILFKNKYDLYSDGKTGIKIDLNKNFRSRSDVLDGINYLFDYIMNEDIGGAEYRLSHRMIYGNKAYDSVNRENYKLEVLNYIDEDDYTKEEIEIFIIANDIKNKVSSGYEIIDKNTWKPRKIRYEDFAILLDRSSSFGKYKKIFEYLQIPLNIYRDKSITESVDICLIKHIYNMAISIYNRKFDELFKHSYMSLSRSFLFEKTDNEIFTYINNIKETDVYKKCKFLSNCIEEITNYHFIELIIDEFNFYEKIIKVGDIEEHLTVIDSVLKIAKSMDEIGYTPFDFLSYLDEVLDKGLDIKLKINKGSKSAVKIMTIHASKGLEYPVCYYAGLSKKFNIDDLKSKFYYDKKYGLVIPYIDGGEKQTILKLLLKNDFIKEEISEKLRLFYVALTRAREKMIIVTSIKDTDSDISLLVDDSVRLKYSSFKDIIDSVSSLLSDSIVNIDNKKLGLSKGYNFSSRKSDLSEFSSGDILDIVSYKLDSTIKEKNNFSKRIDRLLTKEEISNINMGTSVHELFERLDFNNIDFSKLNSFEKKIVDLFLKTNILDNTKEVYKEYEFIDDGRHGIIDLLLIKENENVIIDYKLKNIDDEAYINQLNGYKDYIEKITDKSTNVYLYSVMDGKLQKM